MKFNIIIATCAYPELDDAITKSIELATTYDTIIRLKVIKDTGRMSRFGTPFNANTKCTISKNSKPEEIKKYLEKMFTKGNVTRGC